MSIKPKDNLVDLVCLTCTKRFHGAQAVVHSFFSFHSRFIDDEGNVYTLSINFKYIKKLIRNLLGLPKKLIKVLFSSIKKVGIVLNKRKKE